MTRWFNKNEEQMILQNYQCLACGYSANSLTATSEKRSAAQTFHCLGCKSIIFAADFIDQNLETIDQAEPKHLMACPQCESPNIKLWDYKHPCPRCGEHMTKPITMML